MSLIIPLLEKQEQHKTIVTDGLLEWFPIWSLAYGLVAKIGQHILKQ